MAQTATGATSADPGMLSVIRAHYACLLPLSSCPFPPWRTCPGCPCLRRSCLQKRDLQLVLVLASATGGTVQIGNQQGFILSVRNAIGSRFFALSKHAETRMLCRVDRRAGDGRMRILPIQTPGHEHQSRPWDSMCWPFSGE